MKVIEHNKVAEYLRLSREDGDKMESDSIKNQRDLVRDYLAKHPDLHHVAEYVDDGYSGTNFERPGFQKMMKDIQAGKINCIIVKDLSRFGRNYIEVGKYLERVFPSIGVRLISILDQYDSAKENSDADRIIIPFKNLINDAYCRDLSMKVRSQLDVKRKSGKFIGSFTCYGYAKDPKDHNRLVVDPPAAEIVRFIYDLKLSGYNSQRIVDKLNEIGTLPPSEYKLSCGYRYFSGFRSGANPQWTVPTVNTILMTAVAYIRMSTCHPLRQIPANHITQQSDRIKAYAKRKGRKIAARYCDRKHDSAECTAFEQMVEDGLQRKFDMVIVDSIYGAGMDLESVKRVLLQTFHHAGISFAVVEDDFVSREKSIVEIEAYFQRADLELQKANIQKRNIEKSQRLQWRDIKYGYRLLDSGELAIDMRTAPIVQRMYQMRLSGKTLSQIASTLNQEGIPGPRGDRKPDSKWKLETIHRILHSSAYVGYWYKTVQGKQVRLELEPIVSKEDYDAVQRICAPSGSDAGSQEKNNLMVSLVVYESSGEVLKTKKNCSGERYFYDKLNWAVGYERHIPCDVIQRIAVTALENECRLARDMEKLLPEELDIRKQKVLTKLREEMRCQLEYVANALKTENNSRVVLDSEPIFQTFMETANDIEIAFSQKNPWIRLYSSLELDSLDSNLAFRHCIEEIEVCRDGRILFVPKEEKWKQLLSQ